MQGSTRGRAAAPDTAPDRLAGDRTASDRGWPRWEIVDFLRGCAIVAMIVYHFCFDLALNGWLVADFGEDLRWLAFRVPILGSFLFIAGLSLALAEQRGQTARQFWRRVGIIAGAALLVSIGSFFVFPRSFIYFGVLHAIALMSVLARWLLPVGRWLPLLALGFLLLGIVVRLPVFDQPALHWIGMMTFKPRTEDYVPLFPWFGAFLLGASIPSWLSESRRNAASAVVVPATLRWISWLGRHSLAIYLIHQPLLLGAMLFVRKLL